MAHVVVRRPLRQAGAQRQDRRGAIEGLDLALLVDTEPMAFSGGARGEADNVAELRLEGRVDGGSNVPAAGCRHSVAAAATVASPTRSRRPAGASTSGSPRAPSAAAPGRGQDRGLMEWSSVGRCAARRRAPRCRRAGRASARRITRATQRPVRRAEPGAPLTSSRSERELRRAEPPRHLHRLARVQPQGHTSPQYDPPAGTAQVTITP